MRSKAANQKTVLKNFSLL